MSLAAPVHRRARLIERLKRVALHLAFVIVSTPVCASPVVELRFWTMQLSPFHDEFVRGVIRDFEAGHANIRVKWVDVPWSDMEKKVLTSIAAGTAPDLVNLNPQFATRLAEFGALADPERFLSTAERERYLPAAWSANRMDGKTFALPWYLTTNIVLYNTRIFASAGQRVPTTSGELVAVARALKTGGGPYAYFPALDGSAALEALVGAGAALLDARHCAPGFVNASGEAVLDTYRRLYQDRLIPRNVLTDGHRKSVEMFLAGQVAMITTGTQFLDTVRNGNPALYATLEVAPAWRAPDVPPNIAAMNVAVLTASRHQAAAFRFAVFLTNAENQLRLARRVPVLPSAKASYDDAFFTTPSGDALKDRARALAVTQVKEGAVLVPPVRHYNKLKQSYARNLQAVMLGRQDVKTGLAKIDHEWRAALGCGA
ncbi:MAG: sugar ABC transporter substrate-binding protein [Betaproteobacteria bacterium]|nr:sugar ABC transporter substrate-binding protein [Betaproteobacteria bacterium]